MTSPGLPHSFPYSIQGTANPANPRVLMVTPRFFPYIGGIETVVFEVSTRLARRGVQVTVLSTDVSRSYPLSEVVQGVRVLRVPAYPPQKDYYFAPALTNIITEPGRWDIVHCQGVHTFVPLLAMRAARRAGLPYLLTFHAGGNTTAVRSAMRKMQWRILRPLLADAAYLIGDSSDEADSFQRELALPAHQFTVVRCGVSGFPVPSQFSPARQGAPQILSVGRLERYKGHHRVIAALPIVRRRYPTACLRIVGLGQYEQELRRLVQQLGLDSCVQIGPLPPGDTEGMAKAYLSANVVTLLSEHEGQGLAAYDALWFRRPVVVTYATALKELVDGGMACGVSLDASPEEIAAAIIQQVVQPLLPEHMNLPTWDECTERLLSVYRQVVSGSQALLRQTDMHRFAEERTAASADGGSSGRSGGRQNERMSNGN